MAKPPTIERKRQRRDLSPPRPVRQRSWEPCGVSTSSWERSEVGRSAAEEKNGAISHTFYLAKAGAAGHLLGKKDRAPLAHERRQLPAALRSCPTTRI
eukprot:1590353-Pyramimonas_sp.AAC.1